MPVPHSNSAGPSTSGNVAARIVDQNVSTSTFESYTEKTTVIKPIPESRHIHRHFYPWGRYCKHSRKLSSSCSSLKPTVNSFLKARSSQSTNRRNIQTRAQELFIIARLLSSRQTHILATTLVLRACRHRHFSRNGQENSLSRPRDNGLSRKRSGNRLKKQPCSQSWRSKNDHSRRNRAIP